MSWPDQGSSAVLSCPSLPGHKAPLGNTDKTGQSEAVASGETGNPWVGGGKAGEVRQLHVYNSEGWWVGEQRSLRRFLNVLTLTGMKQNEENLDLKTAKQRTVFQLRLVFVCFFPEVAQEDITKKPTSWTDPHSSHVLPDSPDQFLRTEATNKSRVEKKTN